MARDTMNWRRLWQPRRVLFWLILVFNGLSSLCGWALRTLPLNLTGQLLLAFVALLNVVFGLLAVWQLLREDPSCKNQADPFTHHRNLHATRPRQRP